MHTTVLYLSELSLYNYSQCILLYLSELRDNELRLPVSGDPWSGYNLLSNNTTSKHFQFFNSFKQLQVLQVYNVMHNFCLLFGVTFFGKSTCTVIQLIKALTVKAWLILFCLFQKVFAFLQDICQIQYHILAAYVVYTVLYRKIKYQ